ncbi:MAG: histidinol-phosphate transaminase [Deltaproteobacteria bacterium]|nr:histidinol-phosphate transaminase [Deltaproteobacteria bacterium]
MKDIFAGMVPPHVEAISPYIPGKPVDEVERELGITGAIKLASNENPLGPSPKGLLALRGALDGVHFYPDGGGFRLRRALSERLGVTEDEIMLGAGSNDLIDLLVRTFCAPGRDDVLTHRHAFFMYKISCMAAGVTLVESDATAELACDVDALVAGITPRTKLIFLPNPNNPTGSYVPRSDFEKLLEKVPPHVLLVVDEAYHEYALARADYPVAEKYRSKERPLLVTLRTFSKIHGLAGLRVGYGISHPRVVSYLNRVRLPFNVSSVAQDAARAALDDLEHVERSRRATLDGISQLTAGFSALGQRVYPSAANFVLVDVGRDAQPVYQALLRKGVIVRPLRPAGLNEHVRVSVGTALENARAIKAMGEVLG